MHDHSRIVVLLCALVVIGGCRRSIDFSEHAETVRQAKKEANSWPKVDVDWQDQAIRKRSLVPRARAVRDAELRALRADQSRMQSIREQEVAVLRSQMENRPPVSDSPEDELFSSDDSFNTLPPEITAQQQAMAQEIFELARVAQQTDSETERRRRAFAFFHAMSRTKEQEQIEALELDRIERESRKHGVIELTQLETVKSLDEFRFMFLRGQEITDDSLAQLSGLGQLKLLHLDRVAITQSGLSHLEGIPNLKLLIIERVRLPEALVVQLRERLPRTTVHYIPPPPEKEPQRQPE